MKKKLLPFLMFLFPALALAAGSATEKLDLTGHWVGFAAIGIFLLAYALVIAEEFTHMRKSKPVMLAAGIIWLLIAWVYKDTELANVPEHAVKHYLTEFAELFMFLLAAMTYVNAMSERNVFEALRGWLLNRGWGYRKLFWVTGLLSFFLSPLIDNLTTALVMCAVVLAVGKGNAKFIALACINIVVAANAGGAFSPFGDITTLMVWQKGIVHFNDFFHLFIPSVVNFVVPAALMTLAVPNIIPDPLKARVELKPGALVIVGLFIVTVTLAVTFHNVFHLPPFMGMVTGMALLKIFGYFLKQKEYKLLRRAQKAGAAGDITPFDSFKFVARAEWDTLLFFFGVIMCVGALGFIGYLHLLSQYMYGELGPTTANVLVGLLSAIVDNIPVMVAVLEMKPHMDLTQWLLVTLTAGVGGSLLSIGSAAGVALMGQARGMYTFFSHLKWTWAIALGYAMSIWVHLLINSGMAHPVR
jgi:NhaD family Na+/H+ antiporter